MTAATVAVLAGCPVPTLCPAPPDGAPPRGWAALVELGPIVRADARCVRDGRPAVTTVRDAATGREEWRCGACPPGPGEWGHRLDWTPTRYDPRFHPDHHHRCLHTRCPSYTPNQAGTPISASALLDERAAANGKNRAPVHVRQAAREAQERRKTQEKALRKR
ncbi:MAG: hypothetical protein ACRCYX_12560 [Dermatophilaceae bacterium]